MWRWLSPIWRSRPRIGHRHPPAIPPRQRIYAIGDVHGRLDLLGDLLRRIEREQEARPPTTTRIVLIGDLIDRGPGSASLLHRFAVSETTKLICLRGNHEAAMLHAWEGSFPALRLWLEHGGRATLRGFGATDAELDDEPFQQMETLRRVVPAACIPWLRALPLHYVCGDYLFVHAGVRPGVALKRQREHDMLWIREEFLSDDRWHGKMVVHGHTPVEKVEILPNRIGIDTGAYYSGRLSAIGLEGTERWVLHT